MSLLELGFAEWISCLYASLRRGLLLSKQWLSHWLVDVIKLMYEATGHSLLLGTHQLLGTPLRAKQIPWLP